MEEIIEIDISYSNMYKCIMIGSIPNVHIYVTYYGISYTSTLRYGAMLTYWF